MKLIPCVLVFTCCAALAATEEQINKTFEVAPGGELVVNVDFGSIEVTTNAGSEVAVDAWRKITRRAKADEERFLRENPVTFRHDGNTVTIQARHKEVKGWFSGRGNRNEAKYILRVPAEFNARLDTSGGGISVADLSGTVKADTSGGGLHFERLHGPLNGDTSGGGIHVTDCEGPIRIDTSGGGIDVMGGGGSLEADTSGGAITVKSFAGPASLDTSGGGITVENVNGKVKGDTSGGPIHAVLVAPLPGDVELSTSGGGITVKVPETASFVLDAEASGGGISCELPITIQGKKESDELKGSVNGGGPRLKLETSGGGIRVKKL